MTRTMLRPFIKCLGGKAELAPRIAAVLPVSSYPVYVEPFLGGAAVYFHLRETGAMRDDQLVILGDADNWLIDIYAALQKNPGQLYRRTKELTDELSVAADPDAYYKAVRGAWNDGCKKAWHTYFLHRASFNGLWRINQKGEMNAAWCKKRKPFFPDEAELTGVSEALAGVELLDWDFRQYEEADLIGPESCVYLDPPYHDGFTGYTEAGFSEEDQLELIRLAARWEERGAHIVYSNADTEFIRDALSTHWPTAHRDEAEMRRPTSLNLLPATAPSSTSVRVRFGGSGTAAISSKTEASRTRLLAMTRSRDES
jgi:DNA adenine methylase